MSKSICEICFRELKVGETVCRSCGSLKVTIADSKNSNPSNSESDSSSKVNFENKPSGMLIIGILFFPFIFSWFSLKKGYNNKFRLLAFWWVWIILFAVFSQSIKNSNAINSSVPTNIVSNSATHIKSSLYNFDDEDVLNTELLPEFRKNKLRLLANFEILDQVFNLITTDFKVEGREKRSNLKEILVGNNYSSIPLFSGTSFFDEYIPKSIQFYCAPNDNDNYSPLSFGSDYSKCYKDAGDNSYFSYLYFYLKDPIYIRNIFCVIDGFILNDVPICRSQSIFRTDRDEITNEFYELRNIDTKKYDLFIGDLVKIDLEYSGFIKNLSDFSVSSFEIVKTDLLIFAPGRSSDKSSSDACFRRYKSTKSFYDEEVLNENFIVDSKVLCGVWKKKI